ATSNKKNIIIAIAIIIGLLLCLPIGIIIAIAAAVYFYTTRTAAGQSQENQIKNLHYKGIAEHAILMFVTCGIYLFVWDYHTTDFLNCVEDEEKRDPSTTLLLCIFIPFYSVYWTYKSAQRIDKLAKNNGIESDLSTVCLILSVFAGFIPPILMQDKINALIIKTNGNIQTQNIQPTAQKLQTNNSVVFGTTEELKKYKELLDSGVITQDEFEAKKKQLLSL
ncbi:MAG: DUF4234 domain-containing protein, partial [Eubacterium sp.]|nr:DUF4234 domain-containing protein [Eubacterium sp.]